MTKYATGENSLEPKIIYFTCIHLETFDRILLKL